MSQIVPTQNGYIDTDPFGFKQAQDMGMRLQERADQHQAFLQDQVLNNQKMSVQDIMNHLNLAKDANPVDAQGNVNVPAQPTVDRVQSIPQGEGNAPQDSATLDQLRNLPATQTSLNSDASGLQQNPTGDQSAASLGQMLSLPQTQTNLNPGVPTQRPAEPSRTVSYSDAQGNKQSYEIKTPQDIAAMDAAAARAKYMATAVPVSLTKETQKRFGVSLPDFPIQPEHLAGVLQAAGQEQPFQVTDPRLRQIFGDTVPFNRLPQVVAAMNNLNTQDNATQRNTANNTTKENVNANTVQGANDRNVNTVAGANQRNATTNNTRVATNAATNSTRLKVAAMPARTQAPNPNKPNPQQVQLAKIQANEDKVHADRIQTGQVLANPSLNATDKAAANAQLTAQSFKLQAFQYAKAKVLGAQAPPQNIQTKLPEGTQMTSPDGHVWAKKNGIVYITQ
jgi:hypothetical protein